MTNQASSARSRADHVVEGLVEAGLVHPDRRTEARTVVAHRLGVRTAASATTRTRLVEVAGYLGGALVVASLGLLLADNWVDLGERGQVAALVVISLVLAVAGLVVANLGSGLGAIRRGHDDVRRRLSSALLTGAAIGGAVTVARLTDLARDAEDYSSWPGLTGGFALVALGAAVYALVPSALVQLALAGGALTTVTSAVEVADASEGTVTGLLLLGVGVTWLALAETRVLREDTTARSVGLAFALLGAQVPLFDDASTLAYVLTGAVAAVAFALYLRLTAWPYLVAGVVGVTLVVPEAIIEWTDGALGAGGAVLLVGLTLLAASAAGLRMRQEAHED